MFIWQIQGSCQSRVDSTMTQIHIPVDDNHYLMDSMINAFVFFDNSYGHPIWLDLEDTCIPVTSNTKEICSTSFETCCKQVLLNPKIIFKSIMNESSSNHFRRELYYLIEINDKTSSTASSSECKHQH